MNAMNEKISDLVSNLIVNDASVFVVVDNIKKFKSEFDSKVSEKKNKNRDFEKRRNHLLKLFVREAVALQGKHIKVSLLSKTEKTGLYRNEKGHFVKF